MTPNDDGEGFTTPTPWPPMPVLISDEPLCYQCGWPRDGHPAPYCPDCQLEQGQTTE